MPFNKTPFELFFGRKPDLSSLKVFGCSACRFVEVGVKTLDSKAIKEIFVGYDEHTTHSSYNQETGKMHLSKNVSFNEKDIIGVNSVEVEGYDVLPETGTSLDFPNEKNDTCSKSVPPSVAVLTPEEPSSITNQDKHSNFKTRIGRHVKLVQRFGCPMNSSESVSFVECFACEEVPNCLEDVENSEARDEWFAAMKKGFDSLVANKTWELCDLPDH